VWLHVRSELHLAEISNDVRRRWGAAETPKLNQS